MSFLVAEWRRLAIANYEVEPQILQKYLPKYTELDIWNGKAYVSVVAFMFKNTKVLGVKVPFHINFEEANLRFYVRHKSAGKWKRGVVFISEIVPKFAIAAVANLLYKEHYSAMPMRHVWFDNEKELLTKYEWRYKGSWQRFEIRSEANLLEIPSGSDTEFITEHYWGYSRINAHKTVEYEVTHPRWHHYKVKDYEIQVDFANLYGHEFAHLSQAIPDSVMLAEGSPITVESRKILAVQ
ncbi:MAG: DUF2071 domain-containing protein [Bernardetiaceae bacterium]|nr:DUF2071 domain-containing protein [Bernardetiaceae bacterium]